MGKKVSHSYQAKGLGLKNEPVCFQGSVDLANKFLGAVSGLIHFDASELWVFDFVLLDPHPEHL